jgi:hypothetical protein
MVRTPGGENTSTIRANVGAPIILWSVDTLDWKYRDEDRAYNAIISSAKDGAIVLMHDLYKTSVAAALRAVDTLKKDGYEFVTVSELLRRRSITVESGTVYTNASSQNGTLASYSAPTYTVRENQYDCSVTAELKAEKGLTLYYTTDGSYPNLSSKKYTKALSITSDTTLTIIGVDAYGTRTPVTTAKISSKVAAFTPTIKYSDGLLSLTTKTTGANIYYTTDGSTPTTSSTRYTGPFEPSGTVKFIAQKDGKLASSVGSCTVTKYGSLFTDISEKAWYYDSVSEVVERGWMTGTDSYKFSPNDAMNRAMMITALYKFDGAEEAESSAPFTDVAEDAWYKSAVDWAYDAGIIEGAGDGHFNPNGTLTREQLVTILYRYAKYRHAKTDTEQNIDYDDAADISAFAESAMAWAVAERLINGEDNGLLHPQDAATRAQCAAVLLRLDLESAKPVTISSALNKFIKPAIV